MPSKPKTPAHRNRMKTLSITLKKKRRIKGKGNQTAHSPGHVTNNHKQKLYRPDKHPPRRPAEKNNTTTLIMTEKPNAQGPATQPPR